ncbi:hypothetical protein FIBSPDRAFT_872905, partial [Athelia psychrophila]
MDIPPMKRLPTKPRGTKRVVEEESDGEGTGQKKRTRRAVTNSAQPGWSLSKEFRHIRVLAANTCYASIQRRN